MATRRGERGGPRCGGRLLRGRPPRRAAARTAGPGAPSPPTAWPPAAQHSTAAGRACRLQSQRPGRQGSSTHTGHTLTVAIAMASSNRRYKTCMALHQQACRVRTLSSHDSRRIVAPDQPAWSSASSLQKDARPCPPMHSAISTIMSRPAASLRSPSLKSICLQQPQRHRQAAGRRCESANAS